MSRVYSGCWLVIGIVTYHIMVSMLILKAPMLKVNTDYITYIQIQKKIIGIVAVLCK